MVHFGCYCLPAEKANSYPSTSSIACINTYPDVDFEIKNITINSIGSNFGIWEQVGSGKYTHVTVNLTSSKGESYTAGIVAKGGRTDLNNVTLNINATNGGLRGYGLLALDSAKLSNVFITSNSDGIQVPQKNDQNVVIPSSTMLTINNVTVNAEHNAMYISGSAEISNSVFNGKTYGIFGDNNVYDTSNAILTIRNSKINSFYALNTNRISKISFSEIDAITAGSNTACFNVHDSAYAPLVCQTY